MEQLYVGLYLHFKSTCEYKRLQEGSNLQHFNPFQVNVPWVKNWNIGLKWVQ